MEDTENTQIAQTEEISKKNKKRDLPIPLKIIRGFFLFIAIVLVLLLGWIGFSALDRAKPLEFLPENYTAVVHTDSVFNAAAPIVELKAADTLLAEEQFASLRGAFMNARDFFNNSNFLLNKILSRRVDVALYAEQGGFVAVVDLSYLSAATRLSKFAARFASVPNLSFNENHFEYDLGGQIVYMKPHKNLAIVSFDKSLFEKAVFGERIPSEEEIEMIEGEKIDGIKIIANAKKITELILEGNDIASEIVPLIKNNSFTSVQFSLSNDDIDIQLKLPLLLEGESSPIAKLLQNPSTTPKLLPSLTSEVQYYTTLNFSSLENFKDAAFQIARQTQDIDSIWKKANNLCKTLFSLSVDDMLFSWSGGECAVLGIEGSSDPVFALQIVDEAQRKKIFEKLSSSILLNTNTSLLVGGMRLPCFELPPLLSGLLKMFGIALPRPYYLVQNGFVYFSMSPQNLSAIYTHAKKNYTIAKNENWKRVSQNVNANSSVGIYYNLKRSMPFFIDNSSTVAKILRLYGIGRCDIAFGNEAIDIHLHASSVMEGDTKQVPGFPIATNRPSDFILHADAEAKNVFWLENDGAIKSLNLASLEQHEFKIDEPCFIASVREKSKDKGVLWAATANGNIYLFDEKLECLENFPIITGEQFSAAGVSYNKGFAIPCADGKIIHITEKGDIKEMASIPDANFKAAPGVLSDTMAIYNRGFEGEIYILEKGILKNQENPFVVDGIGFGSPCVAQVGKKNYVAFLTQAGTFYLFDFDDANVVEGFPIEIEDVFFTNAVFLDNAFFAISQNALLYKISLDGSVVAVQLPDTISAKEGIIFAYDDKKFAGVYASGDNNILYGFDSNLELLISFPAAGRGKPIFADVNNDKKTDCMVLSVSRELNVWNMD